MAVLLVFGFSLSGVSGVVAYFLPAISAALSITGHPTQGKTPKGGKPLPTPSTSPLSSPNQPFNVLLLGSDNDTKFEPDDVLTQTMILVRINPPTNPWSCSPFPETCGSRSGTTDGFRQDRRGLRGWWRGRGHLDGREQFRGHPSITGSGSASADWCR